MIADPGRGDKENSSSTNSRSSGERRGSSGGGDSLDDVNNRGRNGKLYLDPPNLSPYLAWKTGDFAPCFYPPARARHNTAHCARANPWTTRSSSTRNSWRASWRVSGVWLLSRGCYTAGLRACVTSRCGKARSHGIPRKGRDEGKHIRRAISRFPVVLGGSPVVFLGCTWKAFFPTGSLCLWAPRLPGSCQGWWLVSG